jgi:hypothetical protein
MAAWDALLEDDGDTGTDLVKQLRKALKDASKVIAEKDAALADVSKQVRERSIKDVLEAKGANPKIAKYLPADVTTPEQVEAWLAEDGELFGYDPAPVEGEPGQAPAPPKGLTLADIGQMSAVNAATAGSIPVSVAADLEAKINAATNPGELAAALAAAPRNVG